MRSLLKTSPGEMIRPMSRNFRRFLTRSATPQGTKNFSNPFKREWLDRRGAVLQFGKNQTAGGGLKRARNDDSPRFANMRARMIHHDHCSIRQITDGLVRLPAFFDQMQIDLVPRNNARAKRASEIGKIQNADSLQPRNLSQRVIVGQQTRL